MLRKKNPKSLAYLPKILREITENAAWNEKY